MNIEDVPDDIIKQIENNIRFADKQKAAKAMAECLGDGPCVGPFSDELIAFTRFRAREILKEIEEKKKKSKKRKK